jgi:asparagine N-glycosylation enzyme membrane subunit Stt3
LFVSFSVPVFLFWAFIAAFLPGAIISFSVFRNVASGKPDTSMLAARPPRQDELNRIEKLLVGFALGMVALPLIPFLLYFALGIKFSYAIALLSVAALYAIAIALLIRNKAYEGISLPAISPAGFTFSLPKLPASGDEVMKAVLSVRPSTLICAGLVIVLILTYLVRIGSYSPVFQELDPYYYTYAAHQILSLGGNPENDQTSWYPDLVVDHREIPVISYLESIWYSLYTGGAPYNNDNMRLADIASMYPPIAAVLAVFFIYLLVSVASRREWGVIAAGIAAFTPVFVYKLAAGEHESQPYAFFALFFFYAMYALAVSRKDMRFTVLAGLAFAAVSLGSSSQLLALSAAVIFLAGQAVLLFLRDSDAEGIKQLLISNAIIFAIGPLLGSALLKDIFATGSSSAFLIGPAVLCLGFVGLLYAMKKKLPDAQGAWKSYSAFIILAISAFGIAIFAATPLGDMVEQVALAGFGIAKYNAPLDRTIAEQGGAPSAFDSQLGNIASVFSEPAAGAQGQNMFSLIFDYLKWLIFIPFTTIVNVLLSVMVSFINFVLGTDVGIDPKANSVMLFWILAFIVSIAWSLWKSAKKEPVACAPQFASRAGDEDSCLPLLFLAIVMPPFIVGIIKAKYTIYAGVVLAVAIGFTLEPLKKFIGRVVLMAGSVKDSTTEGAKTSTTEDAKTSGDAAYLLILLLGATLIFMQFTYANFSSSLAMTSIQPLYQNDPAALAPKFKQFCAATNDADICAAAADPLGYAAKGTNYQYSYKLCLASVYSNISYLNNPGAAPTYEPQAAYFRCQRISDYWIDSMEWLRGNTPNGSRIVSWWDYGHWINYFGLRNAVVRNEHASHKMIGEVAHAYVDGSPEVLKEYMKSHGIRYALFDLEIMAGGGQFGGKYGALNYLSCASDNETDVSKSPGGSQCEAEHMWEIIFVATQQPCTISSISNRTGFIAYEMYEDVYEPGPDGRAVFTGTVYRAFYRPECINPADPNAIGFCKNMVKAVPAYCVGQVTLANGQQTWAPYYLNQTYPNGDLKLNKARIEMPYELQSSYHFGPATGVTLLYTDEPIWLENGEVKSGYEDRKGKFYSSNIYRGLVLDSIPGFRLAYTTPDKAVKIYELEE